MSGNIRKAMILAAGEGTRLRPLTLQTPKVLLPIAGVPLIEYTLAWLKSHGISSIAMNLYHLGEEIKAFLGNGSRFGNTIHYSFEKELLGTAGGVKKLEKFFDSTFIVVYGDNLTDFDLSAMVDFHHEKKAIATLALFETTYSPEIGIVNIETDGKISRLVEKPRSPIPDRQSPMLANAAVYVLEKNILDYIPRETYCDFAYDIFPELIDSYLPIYGYVLNPHDYLIDIGTIDKYHKVNEDVKAGRVKIKI